MTKEILIKLINNNLSQRQIAEKLQCSQGNIKYWLKKYNLKTKLNLYNKDINIIKKEKYCPKCKVIKPVDEFYKRSNRNDVGGYCKKCSNEYHTKRVKKVKLKMIKYKGSKCVECGLNIKDSHYSVFDFHHINPNEKDTIFNRIKYQKWDKIKLEIDKCELLCSNCHRLKHSKIEGW